MLLLTFNITVLIRYIVKKIYIKTSDGKQCIQYKVYFSSTTKVQYPILPAIDPLAVTVASTESYDDTG
jgi:hypothetical protein